MRMGQSRSPIWLLKMWHRKTLQAIRELPCPKQRQTYMKTQQTEHKTTFYRKFCLSPTTTVTLSMPREIRNIPDPTKISPSVVPPTIVGYCESYVSHALTCAVPLTKQVWVLLTAYLQRGSRGSWLLQASADKAIGPLHANTPRSFSNTPHEFC